MTTLILGIGNTLLSDEGVGVHVISQLQSSGNLPDDVTLMDGGTLSFILAGSIEDAENLIVIDAADLQCAPGTVQIFIGEDMDRFLGANRKFSVHGSWVAGFDGSCSSGRPFTSTTRFNRYSTSPIRLGRCDQARR